MTALAGSWAGSRRTSALYRHLPGRPGAPHRRGTACTTSRRRLTRSATPGVQMQPDTQTAVADARAANDFLAAVIGEHPGRFQGLAAVPLQDPRQAAAELRRAVRELGLRGALVNDHTLGRYLDEPRFEPFWEMRQDLGSRCTSTRTPCRPANGRSCRDTQGWISARGCVLPPGTDRRGQHHRHR